MLEMPPPMAIVQSAPGDRCGGQQRCHMAPGPQLLAQATGGGASASLPEGGPSTPTSAQAAAAPPAGRDITTFYDRDGLKARWYFQAGLNLVAERHLFWDFASVYSPGADFNSDENWLEGYVKPGIGFDKTMARGHVFYGKLSAVASRTWGTDAFDATNGHATTLEEGYLGLRSTANATNLDLSLGPRELELGDGMLIANGGTSGFERGALKFGPRKAWRHAAIGRMFDRRATLTGYFIEPNELPSNNGHNQLAGTDFRYQTDAKDYIGLTYIKVLRSDSPYIRAARDGLGAPTIIPGGRDGLNAWNLYLSATRTQGALRNWLVTGDLAYETNRRINMEAWGGRAQIGYTFAQAAWKPSLTYTYKRFSGDNPRTAKLERFDPLYYEGSPDAWATGSKSSMVFINTNLKAHELALAMQVTPKDALTFRYAYIAADKLGSPIQFGQATRPVSTPSGFNQIAGVTKHHLSDDVFVEYNHIYNQHLFLTAGISASFPGAGIKAAFPGKAPTWTGAFVNVVVNY